MRNVALFVSMTLLASVALGEGREPAKRKPNSATRLYAATTILNAADGGLISVGFSALARMAPGGKSFQTLHTIPGDSLYRVAASPRGEVLATWEKDPSIHFFTRDGQHVLIPKPASPREGISGFDVEFLGFLPNGREALVHMDGSESGKNTRYDVTFRLALDRTLPPEPVVTMVGARRIDMTAQRAVYVVPKNAEQSCSGAGCASVQEVVAFVFDDAGNAQRQTLLARSDTLAISNANMVWGQKDAPVVLRVDLERSARVFARWRPGDAKAELQPFPYDPYGEERFYALASGEVIGTKVDYDEGLTLTRYPVHGGQRVTRMPVLADDPDNYDHKVHGVGVRKDGRLFLQWGDQLLFFAANADAPARAYDLEPQLPRHAEWAGVDVYVSSEDALWIGIDSDRSRGFVKVSLAELEKRARAIQYGGVAKPGGD